MLPRALAEMLEAQGHEANMARRLKIGSSEDTEIWERAEQLRAVIISKDSDFPAFVRPHSRARLVHDRHGNETKAEILERYRRHLPTIIAAFESGEKIVEIW
jgi:predicted nuclease of predicted toxin-antitoxin system